MEPGSHAKFREFFASVRADGPKALELAWLDYANFEDLLRRCVDPLKAIEGEEASSPEILEGKKSGGLWSSYGALENSPLADAAPTNFAFRKRAP